MWILKPVSTGKDTAWHPWYDKTFGLVVRAETEEDARNFASTTDGDENPNHYLHPGANSPWRDPIQSTCIELTRLGEPGVILEDCHWA